MISEYGIYILLVIGGYLAAKGILPGFFLILIRYKAVKKNWQGTVIPSMAGLVFPLIIGVVIVPLQVMGLLEQKVYIYLLAVLLISILGLFDDLWGDTAPKGLRGHFVYSWQKKCLTTGVIKALGTGIAALGVVCCLQLSVLEWILLILTVNAINLLDLRPGRAIKGTLFFLIIALFFSFPDYWLVSITAGILLAYARYDLQGIVMLGDSGSNTLGMTAGLVLLNAPDGLKILLVVFLSIFHAVAEKYSFSMIIERYAILKKFDQWGQKVK